MERGMDGWIDFIGWMDGWIDFIVYHVNFLIQRHQLDTVKAT